MNKILIALFLIMPVFGVEDLMLSENQILSYEIPPSAYLEKLAEISEKKAGKSPIDHRALSLFLKYLALKILLH